MSLQTELTAIPQRVQAGMRFLDKRSPGWEETLDPSELNIASTTDCIVCKVTGICDYLWARNALAGDFSDDFDAIELGFDANRSNDDYSTTAELQQYYAALEAEWAKQLLLRARQLGDEGQ